MCSDYFALLFLKFRGHIVRKTCADTLFYKNTRLIFAQKLRTKLRTISEE